VVGNLGQGVRRTPRRLGNGMVVLMPGKSSASRKCTTAVQHGAHVWPFARVNPSVASQRTRVTEPLVAKFALVRLLAGVDSFMHG